MESNKELNINIGLPSIMLIFVSLCLVSFAILTLVSANSDLKLSQKIADRTLTYYGSCNQAQYDIAEINSEYLKVFDSNKNEVAYYQKTSNHTLSYPIGELQSLVIEIQPHFPDNTNNKLYEIVSWKITTNENIEYNESLNVIVDF